MRVCRQQRAWKGCHSRGNTQDCEHVWDTKWNPWFFQKCLPEEEGDEIYVGWIFELGSWSVHDLNSSPFLYPQPLLCNLAVFAHSVSEPCEVVWQMGCYQMGCKQRAEKITSPFLLSHLPSLCLHVNMLSYTCSQFTDLKTCKQAQLKQIDPKVTPSDSYFLVFISLCNFLLLNVGETCDLFLITRIWQRW